jgi:predicted HicB family RNase H-like nuclease
MMTYKGYIAHIVFDDAAEIFHGEVVNTRDVITFQGVTVKELKKQFIDSVDDYLAFCDERGEEPDKPFSGRFNLRLTPELHRDVSVIARTNGKSLNEWVVDAIRDRIGKAAGK